MHSPTFFKMALLTEEEISKDFSRRYSITIEVSNSPTITASCHLFNAALAGRFETVLDGR